MSNVSIAFASTGYGPMWPPAVQSWLSCVAYTARFFAIENMGKVSGTGVTDRTYTTTAQNQLVAEALADPGRTHLFLTESDMLIPHNAITRLLELDKDIASGIYFLRAPTQGDRGQPCLFQKVDRAEAERMKIKDYTEFTHTPIRLFNTNKPFRVDACGVGCILIKRKVLESIKSPLFDNIILPEGTVGSDMFFATRARQAGFEMWVDPQVLCSQIDYYVTDITDYSWRLQNDHEFAKSGFIIGCNAYKS